MDEETKKEVAKEMKKTRDLPRRHASFFNSHNKESKEIFICSESIKYLESEKGASFDKLYLGEDPPDCVVVSGSEEIAIEVVELVDQEAIEKQIKFNLAYPEQREWTTTRFMEHLNKLIQAKDNPENIEILKKKYQRYIALIHTDEPELRTEEFERLFNPVGLEATNLVSEAYLLFSYDPRVNKCPVKRLI